MALILGTRVNSGVRRHDKVARICVVRVDVRCSVDLCFLVVGERLQKRLDVLLQIAGIVAG